MFSHQAARGPSDTANGSANLSNDDPVRRAPGEKDTCRICRGEGSREEPLFYPCKCSGSIKFVHQECLMEWLSHSNKKHCELCKTPFRFTKLYDPKMPETLPVLVFLGHLLSRGVQFLLTWLRLTLVSLVWFGWLPWSMRACWRLLFWLGDGGFANWERDNVPITAQQALEISRERARKLGISPFAFRTDLPLASSSSRPSGARAGTGSGDLFSIAESFKRRSGNPATHMLNRLFGLGPLSTGSSPTLPTSPGMKTLDHLSTPGLRQSSLLSNITFLNQLTDSPALNKVVIDALEGQLITLFVVVVSILIFLIREWVVQQQFGVNLEGDLNGELEPRQNLADINAGARAAAEDQPREPLANVERRPRNPENSEGLPDTSVGTSANQVELDTDADADEGNSGEILQPTPSPSSGRLTQMAQFVPSIDDDVATSTGIVNPSRTRSGENGANLVSLARQDMETGIPDAGDPSHAEPHRPRRRPRLQPRNSSSTAVQIHRAIEEDGFSQVEHSPPSRKIMDLWLQVDRNMEEFLRNARHEEPTTDLLLVIEVLSRLQEIDPRSEMPATLRIADKIIIKADARSLARQEDNSTEAEGEPPGISQFDPKQEQPRDAARDKGKRKALDASNHSPALEENSQFGLVRTPDPLSTSKRPPQTGYEDDAESAETWSPAPSETPHPPTPESPGHHSSAWNASVIKHMELNRVDTSPVRTRSRSSSLDGRAGSNSEASLADNPRESNLEQLYDGQEHSPVREARLDLEATDLPEGSRRGVVRNTMDWLWGDIDADRSVNDVLPVNANVRENAPHNPIDPHPIPIARGMGNGPRNPFGPDVDEEDNGAEAALLAGADAEDVEAIEDGEDFDGIMELAGVRGPLAGLFQNAMFSVVLLSAAVAAGIGIPYIWGKVVLVILANPILIFVKLPLQWFSLLAELTTDLALFFGGSILSWLDQLTRLFLASFFPSVPFLARYTQSTVLSDSALLYSERALDRIARLILATSFRFSVTDYPGLPVTSYKALQSLKTIPRDLSGYLCESLTSIYQGSTSSLQTLPRNRTLKHISLPSFYSLTKCLLKGFDVALKEMSELVLSLGKLRASSFNIEIPKRTIMVDPSPTSAHWTATDRIIAIIAGYAMFSLLGALYVRKGTPFSNSEQGRRLEGIIRAGLVQAGGILKVILIISIEMIVFPLYCGLLLDLALLPLFHGATFFTRVEFFRNSPWTSAFVHWFVGTCYMFHFALFVSLCRKILRPGVLYFIRDPDDPTFHPVREVLEKSVTSQLRKIAFSALVYGALVIVCLGSVVWGLRYTFEGVLPIYWSSNEPVLEFPVDLLFYNFLMPVAVKFLRPSIGLRALYTWCFRKCARLLRLTWFLFGERKPDEEGHHVQRTWRALFLGKRANIQEAVVIQKGQPLPEDGEADVYFVKDGKLVRAPGSDQVRVPKGSKVFLEIPEAEDVADAAQNRSENSDNERLKSYTKVYIPPWFRVRIGLFVFLIWIFAAITGVSITIIPLVFGRKIFSSLFPNHLRMNDVYAFAIGVYILGGILYGAFHYKKGIAQAGRLFRAHCGSVTQALHQAHGFVLNLGRLAYAFSAFAFILPGLLAFLFELYIIIPLHTYFAADEKHVIHLVHDWTLGVLYVKIASRFILGYSHSRPARALRAITRNGWLKPDIGLATRFFILPAVVVMGFAIVAPLPLAWLALRLHLDEMTGLDQTQIYRYSYPATLAACFGMVLLYFFAMIVKRWRQSIRDEVYLVGERLHNLGETRGGRTLATTRA